MAETAMLTGIGPDGQPSRWALSKNEFTIGRQPPADLVIPLPLVSRRHATIRRVESGYVLADLGSRNGTFVAGRSVGPEPQRLRDGDEIVLAGVVAFTFHDPSETLAGPRLGRLQGVWIDEETLAVWVDARPVTPPLSPAQFALLTLLHRAGGRVVTRSQIVAGVWPDEDAAGVSGEAIDGLIKRLRKRLRDAQAGHAGQSPLRREWIEVVRGRGLRLVQPES